MRHRNAGKPLSGGGTVLLDTLDERDYIILSSHRARAPVDDYPNDVEQSGGTACRDQLPRRAKLTDVASQAKVGSWRTRCWHNPN